MKYVVEHKTSKGWEIVAEDVSLQVAIAVWLDSVSDDGPVRITAEKVPA